MKLMVMSQSIELGWPDKHGNVSESSGHHVNHGRVWLQDAQCTVKCSAKGYMRSDMTQAHVQMIQREYADGI